MTGAAATGDITTDPAELAKFATLGRDWWDATGPMAPLHKLNPLRVAYIRDRACHHFGRDPRGRAPLSGLRVLDVGCGGGLLAEPLARLGGAVTGDRPVAANIEAARWHAEEAGVEVDYQAIGIEALAADGAAFDLVIASEVVEHVPDVAEFVAAMAAVTRAGRAGGALDAEPHRRQLRQGHRRRRVPAGLAAARHPRLAPLPHPGRARPRAARAAGCARSTSAASATTAHATASS